MKLVDLSITEFAKVLGSDAPAPGGGSAAALSAANVLVLPMYNGANVMKMQR